MTLDIGGQAVEAYLFIVPALDFDLILGRPWIISQKATFSYDHRELVFSSGARAPRTETEREIPIRQITAAAYSLWARRARRRSPRARARIFTASMADIEKALKVKSYSDP